MGLFRPYERTERKQTDDASSRLSSLTPKKTKSNDAEPIDSEVTETEVTENGTVTTTDKKVVRRTPRKKEGATPTRAEAEAARMERLHPTRSPKEQRKAERKARVEQRSDAWDKLENSRERRLLRDYVDSRWTVAEFMLPVMLLVMAGMMMTIQLPMVSTTIGLSMWVLMLATVLNVFLLWRGYKRVLNERYPGTPTRGLGMYMFNRALMIRRFRRPSPAINRGEAIR